MDLRLEIRILLNYLFHFLTVLLSKEAASTLVNRIWGFLGSLAVIVKQTQSIKNLETNWLQSRKQIKFYYSTPYDKNKFDNFTVWLFNSNVNIVTLKNKQMGLVGLFTLPW